MAVCGVWDWFGLPRVDWPGAVEMGEWWWDGGVVVDENENGRKSDESFFGWSGLGCHDEFSRLR